MAIGTEVVNTTVTAEEMEQVKEVKNIEIQVGGHKETIDVNAPVVEEIASTGEIDPNVGLEDTPEAQTTEQVQTKIDETDEAGKALVADLATKGVDFKGIEERFLSKGELDEADRKLLNDAGYADPIINSHISNIKATQVAYVNEVHRVAGGAEAYATLTGHIKTLGKASVDAFNSAVNSGNLASVSMMLEGARAGMARSNGTVNSTVLATSQGAVETTGFASIGERNEAMRDKRYNRDASYTRMVEQKVFASRF